MTLRERLTLVRLNKVPAGETTGSITTVDAREDRQNGPGSTPAFIPEWRRRALAGQLHAKDLTR